VRFALCYFSRVHLNSLLEQGVIALTASRRLAHALRLDYARYAQSRGLTVWRTPQILPWSAWLRQQRLALRASGAASTTRLLTSTQARVLWDDIVATSPVGRELLAPSNAARLAARSWQRLHDYLIPLERLAEYDTAEASALLAWAREFERRCAALDAIDEAQLAHVIFEAGLVPDERIVLVGFDTLTPAMRRLIDRWRTADRVAELEETSDEAASIEVVAATDVAAEIELAAAWSRTQLEQGARSVGIIVGDLQSRREEVLRRFEDSFAPGQRRTAAEKTPIPVVVAAPPSLDTYPLVDAALLVLKLASGECDSTVAGRLLRSPFLGGGISERGVRALADEKLRQEQRNRWDWPALELWARQRQCLQLADIARKVTTLVRSLPRHAAPSEWAERYQALLSAVLWPGERPRTSTEHQTLGKFQDALAEFGSLDSVAPRLPMKHALRRFEELLRDTPFEPETADANVIVIDAATSAGMRFDAVWITGLQAEKFPAAANPDPLIPLELQRGARLPFASPGELLTLAQLQLQRWTRSARQVVLSWPEREGDAELSMSPLLARFPRADLVHRRSTTLRELLFAARPELDAVIDDRAPPFDAASASGGAKILELQSRCPFKAQAQLRLQARALEQIGIGVAPPDRGGILHDVLHEIWAALQSQEALLKLSRGELERRVRDAAQRHAMKTLMPDSRVSERLAALEVDSVVRQVMQLLAIERERPPFKVRFSETTEHYEIGGVSVTLRPDRIDELADGGELLIDYKLGDANRPTQWLERVPGRPQSPQLPLYGLAHRKRLRALAFVVLAAGNVEYRGWSDGTYVGPGIDPYPPKRLKVDLGDPMDWPALQHRWEQTLAQLAERFVAGEAAVDPLRGECDYCHLSTLCRKHELSTEQPAEADDE
jgi:ATP-dependent helicase/nuclease subunit B